MKKPLILITCLLLAGCSDADWNKALNYTGMGGGEDAAAEMSQPAAPAAATTAAVPEAPAMPASNNELCRAVATQDATGSDFDPATQQRVFARSFAQCAAIYNR